MPSSPIPRNLTPEAIQKQEYLIKLNILQKGDFITLEQYTAMRNSTTEEMITFYNNCVAEIKRKDSEKKLQLDNLLSSIDPRLVVPPGESRSLEDTIALFGQIGQEYDTVEKRENFRNKMNMFITKATQLYS